MILKFFKAIWAIFDILMFILAAISLNLTTSDAYGLVLV